ncbi:MAG: DUF4340 domain-containing protein [Mariniblastus sp.]
MNKPSFKTLFMVLLAVVTSGIAASFYPWPERVVESEMVGEPLFESYDTTAVRSIEIEKFNADKNEIEKIQLERDGEKWVLLQNRKYVASNASQVSAAANSLTGILVLEEKTEDQQDHFEYGVVDPEDHPTQPNRSGLGTKIVLGDRNGKPLGKLIVGAKLKDDPSGKKRFVRVPGQPSVYVVDFDPNALATEFERWVDPNLFQLSSSIPIEKIQVVDYRLTANQGVESESLKYRATLNVGQTGVNLLKLDLANGKEWQASQISTKMREQAQSIYRQLLNISFSGVLRKNTEMQKLFEAPAAELDTTVLKSLENFGFYKVGFANGVYRFKSSGGEVSVTTRDGLKVTMYIGGLASRSSEEDLQLSYYVLFSAEVDESIFPMPEKPTVDAGAEVDAQADKEYLKRVADRTNALKAVNLRASAFNRLRAEWVYIVPETVINGVRPDLDFSSLSPSNPASSIGDLLKVKPPTPQK